MDDRLVRTAEHWSRVTHPGGARHWWMHPAIVRHVNRLVCGQAIDGPSAGLHALMRARMPDGGFARGVSVGSGVAAKEIGLLEAGIVQRFALFEISEERLRASKRLARRHGVFDRIDFHCANAFDREFPEGFDLVYWNSSLHHMFDAREAVAWSQRNLKTGGCFAMDDFVGASRFQWTERDLEVAHAVRDALPDRLLCDPDNPGQSLDRRIYRPDLAAFIAADPSEAADSDGILDAIRAIFPDATIQLAGGIVFGLALDILLANFDDEADAALLQLLLQFDESLARNGHAQQAAAIAVKAPPARGYASSPLGRLIGRIRQTGGPRHSTD